MIAMKLRTTLFFGASALAMQGATTVQSGTLTNGTVPAASFPRETIIGIEQLNPSQGVLQSVTISLSGIASAEVLGENESNNQADLSASLVGNFTATINGNDDNRRF